MTLETILKDIYNMVNDMLKLAETKNAGLVVFNSAIIVGLLGVIPNLSNIIKAPLLYWAIGYIIFVIFLNGVSLFFCFSALSPKLKHKHNDMKLYKSNNLIFFGTIAHLSTEEFLDKLKTQYQVESKNESYEKDYASQIVVISQIAMRKFELFRTALLCTLAAILTPIAWLIYLIFFNPDGE